MATHINKHFELPHSEALTCLESKGLMVFIEGTVPDDTTDGLTFNFQKGPNFEAGSCVPFHITSRGGVLIRNTCSPSDSWGSEERDGDMPFTPGQKFNMLIKLKQAMIKVFVNGSLFCQYNHRMPMEEIDHIWIGGNWHITNFFQAMSGKIRPTIPSKKDISHCMHRPHVDFWIRGRPRDDCRRFNVNLKSAEDIWVFHADARVDVAGEHNVLLANTCAEGNNWLEEIRPDQFPFALGQTFDIYLKAEADGHYQFYVDGEHIMDYPHRLPLPSVDNFFIDGDVDIDFYFIH